MQSVGRCDLPSLSRRMTNVQMRRQPILLDTVDASNFLSADATKLSGTARPDEQWSVVRPGLRRMLTHKGPWIQYGDAVGFE